MIANDPDVSGDNSPDSAPKRLKLGSVFAHRYHVEALLGQGGMGAVYRVRDQALAEVVALKLLTLPTMRVREYADMFRREVRLSRRITHANVVHVYDIGEVQSMLYMTMELVDGITLRKAMKNGPQGRIPLEEAVRIAHALANGLAAVHAQGIVHRDLKPGNVMIANSGRVVLADFGIASHVETEDPATSGAVIGTLSYMAPEQFAKQAPSPKTDLYAFGLVLYECLTGALPPRGPDWLSNERAPIHIDLAKAGVFGQPAEITAVEFLIRRCLDNDPAKRPESAEEVSRDLNELLVHEPSRIDIGTHRVDRAIAGFSSRAVVPVTEPSGAIADSGSVVNASALAAQGIPDDVIQDYLAARHDSRLNDPGHLVNAYERLDGCVQRAPNFQQAIASRAIVAIRCWFFDYTKVTEINWQETAEKSVEEALRCAPDLSDTHLAHGMLSAQRFEIKSAARSLIRAIEINPASAEAQEYLGGLEIETGLVERGIPRLVYAQRAMPQRPAPSMVLGRSYALLGRFDEVESLMAEFHRRTGIPTMSGLFAYLRVYAYRWGKRPATLSIAQRKAIKENNWTGVSHFLDALAGTDNPAAISAWVDAFVPQAPNRRASLAVRQASIELCALVGLENKALALLSSCARDGLVDILWLDRCPLLEPLRNMRGFRETRDWVWLNAFGVWN